jgi:hypothetical protein
MANKNVQPYPGPFSIDFQSLQGVVVDVVPGGTRGYARQKEGIGGVLAELTSNLPVHAETLGMAADAHTRINTITDRLEQIRALRPIVAKAAEVLDETEIYLEDEREMQIGTVVEAVRKAARRKDPALLASFEKTIQYHGQIGVRAHKTRRKNAEAAEQAEETGEQ